MEMKNKFNETVGIRRINAFDKLKVFGGGEKGEKNIMRWYGVYLKVKMGDGEGKKR